jgi:hypothetical protein
MSQLWLPLCTVVQLLQGMALGAPQGEQREALQAFSRTEEKAGHKTVAILEVLKK